MATSLLDQADEIARKNQVVPLTNEYDESKGVAGRVASITSSGSPLMEQARTAGTQMAAARGLTNSSLAGQAEQNAVLSAATPIASTDASLYSQTSLANLAAKNQAAVTNANNATSIGGQALGLENSNTQQDKTLAQQQAQFTTQASQAQQQIDAQISQFAQSMGMTAQDLQLRRDTLTSQQQQQLAQLENAKQIAQLQSNTSLATAQMSAETQKAVAGMSQDTQIKVANLEAANKSAISGSGNIASAWSNTMSQIATIQNNPNLEQAAKQTLIQNQIDSFQSFTNFWNKTSGGNVDVSDLLKFNVGNAVAPTTPGTPGGNPVVQPPSRDPSWDTNGGGE